MPFLLMIAAASADLDTLDQAVQRCDRAAVNPMFEGEAAQRSQFLLDTYHEQEGIVADRFALNDQQRALRESTTMKSAEKSASQKQLDLQQAALDDRQKALTTSECSTAFTMMRWMRFAATFY